MALANTVVDFLCTDIARILIAALLVVGTLLLLLTDRTVPDVMWALDSAAITWYFTGAPRTAAK